MTQKELSDRQRDFLVAYLGAVLPIRAEPVEEAPSLQFFMTGLGGGTRTLSLPPTTTVSAALRAYLDKLGLPADLDVWVGRGGKRLSLNATLAQSGVDREATLTVHGRLRGGMKRAHSDSSLSNAWDGSLSLSSGEDTPRATKREKQMVGLQKEIDDWASNNGLTLPSLLEHHLQRLGSIDAVRAFPALDQVQALYAPNLGAGWHDTGIKDILSDPVKETLMRVRTRSDGGVITEMKMAGRPRGKHHGSQGQHVTSFVTTREIVMGACCGLPEADARANLVKKFQNLLLYPAFANDALKSLADPTLVAKINAMCTDLDGLSIDAAIALYVEIREAMPGASLASSAPGDTQGHGEAAAISKLREFEASTGSLTAKDLYGTQPEGNRKGKKGALSCLLSLVDGPVAPDGIDEERNSNALQRLREADTSVAAMSVSAFLMSAAEAFPKLFETKIGTDLASDEMASQFGTTDPDQTLGGWLRDHLATALGVEVPDSAEFSRFCGLPNPSDVGDRSKGTAFSAGLATNDSGWVVIEFNGRPKAYKPGGQEGDHTAAHAMLENTVSNLFSQEIVQKTAEKSDLVEMVNRLKTLLNIDDMLEGLFGLDAAEARKLIDAHMAPRDAARSSGGAAGRGGATAPADDKGVDLLQLRRFIDTEYGMGFYSNAIDTKLNSLGDIVGKDDLLDLAELVLGFVNARPTAVTAHAGSGSKSHNEGAHRAALNGLERAEGKEVIALDPSVLDGVNAPPDLIEDLKRMSDAAGSKVLNLSDIESD